MCGFGSGPAPATKRSREIGDIWCFSYDKRIACVGTCTRPPSVAPARFPIGIIRSGCVRKSPVAFRPGTARLRSPAARPDLPVRSEPVRKYSVAPVLRVLIGDPNSFTPICLTFRLIRFRSSLAAPSGSARFRSESSPHSVPEVRKTSCEIGRPSHPLVSGCLRQTTRHKRSPFRAGAGSTVPPPPASLPGAGRRNRRACART